MKKIILPLTPDQVFALDKLMQQLPLWKPTTPQAKAGKSICLEVSSRINKISHKIKQEADLFNPKKKEKIDLKFYEAYAVFEFVNTFLPSTGNNDYLQQVKDSIQMKL